MTDMQCVNCGTPFAMSLQLRNERRKDGGSFYCPNGHPQGWYNDSDAKRLQKKLDEATRTNTNLAQQVREAQQAEQRAVDEAGKLKREAKRIQRRIHAGVCPCCKRTFQNLARHMKTKHADVK